MSTHAPWSTPNTRLSPPPLAGDVTADVVIVGAGITGIVTAALLHELGFDVIVLDRYGVAEGDSGRTTAHLTALVDGKYHVIAERFGADAARRIAHASVEAIDDIQRLSADHDIACGFSRVEACLYAERDEQVPDVESEGRAAQAAGLPVAWVDAAPLPFRTGRGFTVPDQGKCHPVKFITGMAASLMRKGVRIHGDSEVTDVRDDDRAEVQTAHGSVKAKYVVLATHTPVHRRVAFHTKLAASRTYVVAGTAPARHTTALCWDADDPYHYIRTQGTPSGDLLIVGGADHDTGEAGAPPVSLETMRRYATQRYPSVDFSWRWSGEIYTSLDGLPLIGQTSANASSFLATGFAGNGMTYGVIAARLIASLVSGRESALAELLDPSRLVSREVLGKYVRMNAASLATAVGDHTLPYAHPEHRTVPAELRPGEGAIFTVNGRAIAACRDADGELHRVTATCPHMGCHVRWNDVERTWDCPCHGSRFAPDGGVLNGPAATGLTREA